MTRGRLTPIVLGTLGALAVLAWALAVPVRQEAAPAAAATPTESVEPAAGDTTSASRPPAAPSAAPTTASPAPAEPFVQSFARQPGVRPLKPVPSPTATLKVPVTIDGCDHAYGAATQCVPWTFPVGTTDKCAWLAEHGFVDVRVVGADRQKLDPDGDKIACNT